MTNLKSFIPNSFRCSKSRTVGRLLRQAELILTLNCFLFGDNYYKRTDGVAIGTKMGPSHDNLFVGYTEDQFFNRYNGLNPELYMVATLATVSALLPLPERDSFNLYTLSIPVTHLHNILGKFLTPLTFFINVFPESKGPCTSVYYSLW